MLEGLATNLVPAAADALALRGDPALSALLLGYLFAAGAVWASFCGLLAHRLPRILGLEDGEPTGLASPPSSCDGCGSRVRPLHLVPVVGWVLARGRCPDCGGAVPARYPAAEFLFGCATAAVPLVAGGANAHALALGALLWAGLALAWVDLRAHVLPEAITVPLFFAGLLLSPIEPDAWTRCLGAAVGFGCMWATLAIVGRMRDVDAMSGGDVALAAVAGAWLGMTWLPAFLLAACALFAVHAAVEGARGRRWVPMGPALALALAGTAAVTVPG